MEIGRPKKGNRRAGRKKKAKKANWEFTENKSRTRETDYGKKKDNGTSQVIFFCRNFAIGRILCINIVKESYVIVPPKSTNREKTTQKGK